MSCGPKNYRCPAWVAKRKAILERDGYKCRLCGVSAEDAYLEVHHAPMKYGPLNGSCGHCYLLWPELTDECLTTLCRGCHHEITNIRRKKSNATRKITVDPVQRPLQRSHPTIRRADCAVEPVPLPIPRGHPLIRRASAELTSLSTLWKGK